MNIINFFSGFHQCRGVYKGGWAFKSLPPFKDRLRDNKKRSSDRPASVTRALICHTNSFINAGACTKEGRVFITPPPPSRKD